MKAIKVDGCRDCPKHRKNLYCQALGRILEDMITNRPEIPPFCPLPDWPSVSGLSLRIVAGQLSTMNFSSEHPQEALEWLEGQLRSVGVIVTEEKREGEET